MIMEIILLLWSC